MKKIILSLFCISFLFTIKAQDTITSSYIDPIVHTTHSYNLQQVQNFPCAQALSEQLSAYELYEFDFNELYQFVNSDEYFTEFKLQFGDKNYTINLQRNDLRSPNYKSAIGTENGSEIIFERSLLSDTNYIVKTFKGFANGSEDNIARFTIDENHLTGYVHDYKSKEWIFFDSYQHFTKDHCDDEDALVIYEIKDIIEVGGCQQIILEANEEAYSQSKGMTDICSPKYIEIATEADYEYFENYGNNSNDEILSTLNQAEGAFSKHFNIMFSVTFQHNWEIPNDPYNDERALERNKDEFFPYFQANFSNINRDLSIMFTGYSRLKNNTNSAWNVTGNSLTYDPSAPGTVCKYSITSIIVTDQADKVGTSAHEIGHALGMPHLFDTHPSECASDPGLMCYGSRGFFFNQPSINATLDHLENFGGCLNNVDPSIPTNNWVKTWDNSRNKRWIGTWFLNEGDKKVIGNFDGDEDEEILFMSKGGWSNMIDFSCNEGSDWHHMWSNFGNNTIYTWNMHKNDKYFAGDFDGDGISELLSISHSSSWVSLQGFNPTSNNWSFKWSNYGNGKIQGWIINKSTDKYIIDDFTNDGKDDILCISNAGWAALFSYNGSSFYEIWSNGGNNYLEGSSTPANSAYEYLTGDFNDDGKTDILAFTNYWVTMLDFNTSTNVFNWKWSQWGANNFASMYILPLNSTQRMFSGNFDSDDKTEVLNINNTWSATADWDGSTFQQNWNNGGNQNISDWELNTGTKNNYLTVKATEHNEQHVLGIKFYTKPCFLGINCEVYPELSMMYRSNEISNKSANISEKDIATIEKNYNILLYPNPSNSLITIEIDDELSEKEVFVEVFDVLGQKISSKKVDNSKATFDVSQYAKGIYNVQISSDESVIANHKIMVQ